MHGCCKLLQLEFVAYNFASGIAYFVAYTINLLIRRVDRELQLICRLWSRIATVYTVASGLHGSRKHVNLDMQLLCAKNWDCASTYYVTSCSGSEWSISKVAYIVMLSAECTYLKACGLIMRRVSFQTPTVSLVHGPATKKSNWIRVFFGIVYLLARWLTVRSSWLSVGLRVCDDIYIDNLVFRDNR